jgi:hypothetical protein
MDVQKELMAIPDFNSDDEGPFISEQKAVRNMKKAILMVAGAAVQKLMLQLEDEQEILMAVADMLIETFTAESLLLRVMKINSIKIDTEIEIYSDILKVFVTDSVDRLNKSGKTAINSFAEGDEQRMMLLGLKRFTKYESINTTAARRRIADKLIAEGKYCFS